MEWPENIESALQSIRSAYEGKVRPKTRKQLEQECEEFQSVKAELTRFAKTQGLALNDFLVKAEILSAVVVPGCLPRMGQQEIDDWYAQTGLSPDCSLAERYPDLGVMTFSAFVRKDFGLKWPNEYTVFESLRTGDVFECGLIPPKPSPLSGLANSLPVFDAYISLRFVDKWHALNVRASIFVGGAVEHTHFKDYSYKDLTLLLEEPESRGVPQGGVLAMVADTQKQKGTGMLIKISVAFDEQKYRQYRDGLDYHFDGKMNGLTIEEEAARAAESANADAGAAPEPDAQDSASASNVRENLSLYKKVIKKTFEVGGVPIPIEYKPARALTQLEKYVKEAKRIAPSKNLQDDDWSDFQKGAVFVDEFAPQYGVRRELLGGYEESEKCLTDMMRVIALLTDDEMLEQVASAAPKKKDGTLAGNRVALSVDMDGIFDDGTYYNVSAKSDSPKDRKAGSLGSIEISVNRKKVHWQSKFDGGAAQFLADNAEAVKRLGI